MFFSDNGQRLATLVVFLVTCGPKLDPDIVPNQIISDWGLFWLCCTQNMTGIWTNDGEIVRKPYILFILNQKLDQYVYGIE